MKRGGLYTTSRLRKFSFFDTIELNFLSRNVKSLKPIGTSTLIIAFFFSVIAGMYMWFMSPTDAAMINCPLMRGDSTMCQMNLTDHIQAWKDLFVANIPTFERTIFVILGFALLGFLTRLLPSFLIQRRDPLIREGPYQKNGSWKLFDYLSVALSRGILHPRVY